SLSMESHQPASAIQLFEVMTRIVDIRANLSPHAKNALIESRGFAGQQVSRGGADMKRIMGSLAVLMALAFAATVSAQVQTGSILVRAVDEQGAVMPGVSITISSPVLVGGSMSGVTDAGGVNRFPSLVPGP